MNTTVNENKVRLSDWVGSNVIIKLKSGRTISGFLKEDAGNFTIKLGVKHLAIETETVKAVSLLL